MHQYCLWEIMFFFISFRGSKYYNIQTTQQVLPTLQHSCWIYPKLTQNLSLKSVIFSFSLPFVVHLTDFWAQWLDVSYWNAQNGIFLSISTGLYLWLFINKTQIQFFHSFSSLTQVTQTREFLVHPSVSTVSQWQSVSIRKLFWSLEPWVFWYFLPLHCCTLLKQQIYKSYNKLTHTDTNKHPLKMHFRVLPCSHAVP